MQAVAEPVARTRVVTMVLDLVNPDGTKALNPSVDAAQATAEALARCTEPVTAAYPNGVPVPLPDVFDFTELFTHNTSSNGNIGQSRGGT